MIEINDVLSPQWLSRVLRRPVESLTAERIGADRGFAGVVMRVGVVGKDAARSSLVAKIGPDPSLDAEIDFYQRLAPGIAAPAPQCLYAGEGANGAPVLLLEDMSGAREGNALKGGRSGDVAAVLECMSAVWRHRASEPALRHLRRWGGGDTQGRQARFRQNWAVQRDRLSGELPADINRTADRLCTSLAQVTSELQAAPAHAVHADLHLDNVLFTGGSPVIIDWGSICVGSPAVDVFSFISSSLSPDDQQRHFADLIDGLGFDEATVDAGRRRLLCALAGVIGWRNRAPTQNTREQALRRAALADGRLINAIQQWDAARVLP